MNTALTKKPASILRTYTQQVRDHAAAMQRIQDQYFAGSKRAEAQYFDGVKRITDAVAADSALETDQPQQPHQQQPDAQPEQQAAS